MALLDRFRPKPAWQHEDPSVRAAAVRELPGDDQERLLSIAQGDGDTRVRRAAVRKLTSAAQLTEILRQESDTGVREEAAEVLVALLNRSAEDTVDEGALAVLQDPHHLASLARSARGEALRRAAVGRLANPKALAEVARLAEDAEVRLLALARLSDAAALCDVALRAEHKDAAVGAVERLEPEAWKAVAARARNRAAARRARALLGEAGESVKPLKPAEKRSRRLEVLRRLEGLARSVDFPLLSRELAAAAEAWEQLAVTQKPGVEDEAGRRYLAARAALEGRIAEHDSVVRDEARRRQERESALASRTALRDEAAALDGSGPEARIDELRARFEALAPWQDPEAAACAERFGRACDEARERHRRFVAGESSRARLEEICQRLEAVGGEEAEVAGLRGQAELLLEVATPELRGRYEAALAVWRERGAASREERARAEKENQARILALLEQMDALGKAEHPRLKEAEAALREARKRLGPAGLGPLPGKRDRETLTARLKDARSVLYPRVQELRATREWAQWATQGVREELCARAEALLAVADMESVAREAKDLDARWGQARSAPGDKSEALRERFRLAREALRTRCDAYFAQQAQVRGENLQKKLELCAQAEALSGSTDWLKTAQALVGLQAQWKTIGPAPQRDAKSVWERFRKACDHFFSRRKGDLGKRKEEWTQNLQSKEALCAKAEALAESTDWDAAAAELKRLQAEWKSVGAVRKNRSEAVWQRFRAACDAFFERYKKRDEIGRVAETDRRGALCAELEALAAGPGGGTPPESLQERVKAAQAAWGGASAGALQERFAAAVQALVLAWPASFEGTDLDPEANRKKRESLCAKVEGLGAAATKTPEVPTDLAARIKEALASNTMGAKREPAPRQRMTEEIEAVKAAWKRVGPVPGDAGRLLQERFEAACRRALGSSARA